MTLKEKIYKECNKRVNEKIELLQNTLNDLRASAANETKSTAGDKHETALAMLQIEQENTGRQLKEAVEQKTVLNRINIQLQTKNIVHGSLVKTSKGYFFIAIAIGKIVVDDMPVFVLSPHSPLGAKLVGLQVAEIAEMNMNEYLVLEIE